MNIKVLKGYLMIKGYDLDWLANVLGISVKTLYLKLSGKAHFDFVELRTIKEKLELSAAEFATIIPDLTIDEGK